MASSSHITAAPVEAPDALVAIGAEIARVTARLREIGRLRLPCGVDLDLDYETDTLRDRRRCLIAAASAIPAKSLHGALVQVGTAYELMEIACASEFTAAERDENFGRQRRLLFSIYRWCEGEYEIPTAELGLCEMFAPQSDPWNQALPPGASYEEGASS